MVPSAPLYYRESKNWTMSSILLKSVKRVKMVYTKQ